MNQIDPALPMIIMPAWNESVVIAGTIRDVLKHGPACSVLVVDDGSTDDTAAIAEAAGAHVLRLPFNMGVGGAMRAGFTLAERLGVRKVIQVDADGQHNPSDIEKLLAGLDEADIVIGARFADEGDYEVRGPRKWAMKVLAFTLSRVAKTRLTDTTSGFRAADQKAIKQYVQHYPAEYLGDTIDSLVSAVRAGCVVKQIPVAMRPRQGGVPSQSPVKAAIYLGRSMIALLFALTRSSKGAGRSAQ